MPTPREAYTNQVAQQGYTSARLQTADFGAAGETIGRAVEGVGRTLQGVAEDYNAVQEKHAQDLAREADLNAQAGTIEARSQYLALKGKAAVEGVPEIRETLRKQREAAAEKIKNPRARAMFLEVAARREADELPQIFEHAAQERIQWEDGLDATALEASHNNAVTSMDPDIIVAERKTMFATAERRARRAGVSDAAGIQQQQKKVWGVTVRAMASKLDLDGNAALAMDFVRANEEFMDPDDVVALRTELAPRALLREARRGGEFDVFVGGEPIGSSPPGTAAASTPFETAFGVAPTEGASAPAAAPALARQKPLPLWESNSVNSPFGRQRGTRTHKGMDLNFRHGDPVPAAMDGVATQGYDPDGWGNWLLIDHGKDDQGRRIQSRYAHLSEFKLGNGEQIRQGETIGLAGGRPGAAGAGNSKGEHLHYEFLVDGVPQDPTKHAGIEVNIAGSQNRETAPSTSAAPSSERKFDLPATIAKIKAANLPQLREDAEIQAAKEKALEFEAADNQRQSAAQDAVYAYLDTLASPDDFTDFNMLPANTAMNLSPQQRVFWKSNAEANEQTREARIRAAQADADAARGKLADDANFEIGELLLESPRAFKDIDFTSEHPHLDRRDRQRYRSIQKDMETAEQDAGALVPNHSALRTDLVRFLGTYGTMSEKERKKDPQRVDRLYQRLLSKEQAFIRDNKRVPNDGEREAMVRSVTQPAIIGDKIIPRGEMPAGTTARTDARDEIRRVYMRENNGRSPSSAWVEQKVEQMRSAGLI